MLLRGTPIKKKTISVLSQLRCGNLIKQSNGVARACFSCKSSHSGNRGNKTLHQAEYKNLDAAC